SLRDGGVNDGNLTLGCRFRIEEPPGRWQSSLLEPGIAERSRRRSCAAKKCQSKYEQCTAGNQKNDTAPSHRLLPIRTSYRDRWQLTNIAEQRIPSSRHPSNKSPIDYSHRWRRVGRAQIFTPRSLRASSANVKLSADMARVVESAAPSIPSLGIKARLST